MSGRAKSVLRIGLIAGVVVIYLAMVGMLEQFADVFAIGDSVSLAHVMMAAPALGAGF